MSRRREVCRDSGGDTRYGSHGYRPTVLLSRFDRRGAWIAATVAALAAGAWIFLAAAVVHGEESRVLGGTVRSLRFATLNLYHGGHFSGLSGDARDLDARLEAVVEELRLWDADVIGLQEASTGRGRGNVAERLAAGLGFHFAYAQSNPRILGNGWVSAAIAAVLNFAEGPAIVSRFPVRDWSSHELPACGRYIEKRTVLSATVETPAGPLRVHSAHTLGDPCQTQAVADVVRNGRGQLPTVLMGDFNAVEESQAIATFTKHAGFVDAFRAANPGQPGFTVWQRINEPTSTVHRRVDYLFVAPGDAVQMRVLSSRIILNAPRKRPDGTFLWPSDHYGVLADFEVLGPSQTAFPAR